MSILEILVILLKVECFCCGSCAVKMSGLCDKDGVRECVHRVGVRVCAQRKETIISKKKGKLQSVPRLGLHKFWLSQIYKLGFFRV
jgi:hypothetical protein